MKVTLVDKFGKIFEFKNVNNFNYNELPTPNVTLRFTLGIGFSFAIYKGITVQS